MKLNLINLSIAMSLVMSVIITSCSESGSDTPKYDYLTVQIEEGDGWSLLAPDGDVVCKDDFDKEPTAVINGVFSVEEADGVCALYTVDGGKARVIKNCDELKNAGYCVEGLIPVCRDGERISIVNRKGNSVFTLEPVKGKEIIYCSTAFSEGMLAVCDEDNEKGYFNTKGECVIAPRYSSANAFSEGAALVAVADEDSEREFFIDKTGEKVLSIKNGWHSAARAFKDGLFPIADKSGRHVFIDRKGEENKCPQRVKGIKSWNKDLYVFVNESGETGVLTIKDHEVVLRARYSDVMLLPDGTILAGKGKSSFLFDSSGEELADFDDARNVVYIDGFGFIGQDGDDMRRYGKDGKPTKNGVYFNMGNTRTFSTFVYNHFFNVEAPVNRIISMLTANGAGRYSLGDRPSSAIFGDMAEYVDEHVASPEDLRMSGLGYTISGALFFTDDIAVSRYANSSSWDFTKENIWNKKSELDEIVLEISSSNDNWIEEGYDTLVKALKNKGFAEFVSTPSGAVSPLCGLAKGTLIAVVQYKGDEKNKIILNLLGNSKDMREVVSDMVEDR